MFLAGGRAAAQVTGQDKPPLEQSLAPADTSTPRPDGRMMTGRGMMMAGGRMHGGPMGMRMQSDSAFAADMSIVHELLLDHDAITRTVTALPNGIRTVTESKNPQIAAYIIRHVASMEQRLRDSSVFNVASRTLPTIFRNKDKIRTEIQPTARGVALTQTSDDSATVAALQAHALEVSALAHEGMVAMMRSVMANGGPMGMGGHTPRSQAGGAMGMMGGTGGGMMNGGCPMMGQMMRPVRVGDSVNR